MIFDNEKSSPSIRGESPAYDIVVDKNSKFYHLFNFLAREYGSNLDNLLKNIGRGLLIGYIIKRIKNEKLRDILLFLQKLIPALFFIFELVLHVKHYRKVNRESEVNPYRKKQLEIAKIMNIKLSDGEIPYRAFTFNLDVVKWMLNSPNTKKFKIKKYWDMTTYKEVEKMETLFGADKKEICAGLLIEFNNTKILWYLTIIQIASANIMYNKESCFYSDVASDELIINLRRNIINEYVSSLNIKENVILFSNWDIHTKQRRSIKENINQFNVNGLITEIREILSRKRKRAFAFVGKQGVGKSVILRKIEEEVTDYLVFHITPDDFDNPDYIKDRFEVIKSLQPAIVIIEDLDSCGLKDKNRITGEFLNCIDEVNRDLNIVILVSINDTSLIHYTILNRPGRFDRIFEISSPQTEKEVLEIILSKTNVIKTNYCSDNPLFLKEIDMNNMADILKDCIKYKFTQAEIANAVLEQAFIDINIEMKATDTMSKNWLKIGIMDIIPFLKEAIKKHLKTKEALENCNFNNKNPDEKSRSQAIALNPSPLFR